MRLTSLFTPLLLLGVGLTAVSALRKTPLDGPLDDIILGPFFNAELEANFNKSLIEGSRKLATPDASKLAQIESKLASLPLDATPEQLDSIFRLPPLRCRTNPSSSPPIASAHNAANYMLERVPPNRVCVLPQNGNCATYVVWKYYNPAQGRLWLSACGLPGASVRCSTLAWAMKHISNGCQYNKVAEGDYYFEEAGVVAMLLGDRA